MAPAVYTATVDYSAVNEYVRAHYDQSGYFDDDVAEHVLYDGRILQSRYRDEREMLDENGLAIIESRLAREPRWSDPGDVARSYLPDLETALRGLFPNLTRHRFWNPMIRGESCEISRGDGAETPTANIAPLVHIDTDVGAYDDVLEILHIVEKNGVGMSDSDRFDVRAAADDIVRGRRRFAIVNFWRNIADAPVARAPLAILSTRYDKEPRTAFPDARPDVEESKWYVFPNATRDEAIVFYQYDRDSRQPSDLFHCAVSPRGNGDARRSPPRRSFDVRALVVLDEEVPDELDRFSANRTRPILTLEESGCFCEEQTASRNPGE